MFFAYNPENFHHHPTTTTIVVVPFDGVDSIDVGDVLVVVPFDDVAFGVCYCFYYR